MTDAQRVTSLEVADRVAHVVIERPHKRNALNRKVLADLHAYARELGDAASAGSVGAVVVSGHGEHFSSGLDLEDLAGLATAPPSEAEVAEIQAVLTAYEELDVPVLAAIDGVCLGAGLQLAMACHVRAVTPAASLAVLEPRWGLVPDLGASWRLPRLIGLGRATEMMLSTRRVGATESLAMGLAEIALPEGDALEAGHAIASRWASGPEVLAHLPRLAREAVGTDRSVALAAEARLQLRMFAGGHVQEVIRAAAEGRGPREESP